MTFYRTYTEMVKYDAFLDRFNYLKLGGSVGQETFGYDRHLNQRFYKSREWRNIRHFVIARDLGCDLSMPGYHIYGPPLIHHMNPITEQDIVHGNQDILDPEFLVCVTHDTHNAIHYGSEDMLYLPPPERTPGDTILW